MMKTQPAHPWTAEDILALGRSYQGAAVLAAAADLDLFSALAAAPRSAPELSHTLRCDSRALTILLDALTALRLLEKANATYALPPDLAPFLPPDGAQSVLAMAQHQANCLRRWADLARVVKTGQPAGRIPSVRGEPPRLCPVFVSVCVSSQTHLRREIAIRT
jgi:hypothetical protein